MKGQRETLDQPGQEEERSGKPLHWSCLEVTLELNPKRPVGVIQVEKKKVGVIPCKGGITGDAWGAERIWHSQGSTSLWGTGWRNLKRSLERRGGTW